MTESFHGAKLLLFIGAQLVVIRRDDIPSIPWPGMLDLPGGGREGTETPEDCVRRETLEELGLRIEPAQLIWRKRFGQGVFFAAHLPLGTDRHIVFGPEGQEWLLMDPDIYAAARDVIPHHATVLRDYLSNRASHFEMA